ncbi:MAG TPA: hypothetical protein VFB16_12390 [Bauldia sp.]|nr:hypothetical protein [Bauldia sp.]
MTTSDVLARVKRTGKITADDALEVRRAVYGSDAAINRLEIEAMLEIDAAATVVDPEWTALVSEAGSDFLVFQEPPEGYLSKENADWLTAHISADGTIRTPRMLEMMVHAMERARTAPCTLAALALAQVKLAVVEGRGPLAGSVKQGTIGGAEVEMLRRILYAGAGEKGIAISREEAEVLLDLNDTLAGGPHDPAWDDLFVKAMANFMMAASGYRSPSREVALERSQWLDAPNRGVGGFLGRMLAGGANSILAAYRTDPDAEIAAHNAERDADIAANAAVTAGEAEWLASRLGRDGRMQENEKALLRFIRDEAPSIHPSLQALIARAA